MKNDTSFSPGRKKPEGSGRKPGTPNKTTQDLHEIAERLECNPFEVLIHYAKGDFKALGYEEFQIMVTKTGETVSVLTIPPELRQKSAKDACEYLYPKRKAVEHSGAVESKMSVEQFIMQQAEKK